MKILKILDSHDTGGIYTCECQFIEDMVSRGHQIDGVIIGNGKNVEVYKQLLANHLHLEEEYEYREFRKFTSFFGMLEQSKKIAGFIQDDLRDRYDAIIYRRTAFLFIAGYLSKISNTAAYWFMPKSMQSKMQRFFYLTFLKRFNIIPIANSQYTMSTLGRYCQHFVYPGFDESRVTDAESLYRKKLNIPSDSPVYGIAARLDYEKAHDLVIPAFIDSGIPEKGGHLLIAGKPLEGDYFELLKNLSGNYYGSRIHFLGYVDNMAAFYSSVDIMVNGRRDAEPFGITVAESIAFGKPVIAYYLGGPDEMITDGYNGWLVKKPELIDYRNAFKKSINSKNQWSKLSKNAEKSAQKLSSKSSVAKLLGILSNHE
jgi:glycosyltransferase involved in cell wall biosynthesis